MMARVLGDCDFDLAGVDVAGIRFDIDEDGRGAEQAMTSAVATKVNGVVMISSPGLISSAIRAMSSASVPEATVMQCFRAVYRQRACFRVQPLPAP
jgi:hypothetical protein